MIIMLGHEEAEIDDRHRLAETRMPGGSFELVDRQALERRHQHPALPPELGQQDAERARVVARLVRLAVLEIGRRQLVGPVEQFAEPSRSQRFEIALVFRDSQ